MAPLKRILYVALFLLLIAAITWVRDLLRPDFALPQPTPAPRMLHLYEEGAFVANIAPAELELMPTSEVQLADIVLNGPPLSDVLERYLAGGLTEGALVTVIGASPDAQVRFTHEHLFDLEQTAILVVADDEGGFALAASHPHLDLPGGYLREVSRIDIVNLR